MSPLLTLRRNVPVPNRPRRVGPAPNCPDAELAAPSWPRRIGGRAFQFAIRIDSIRYANRFESIRLVKKSAFRFTSCHAVFSCLFIV